MTTPPESGPTLDAASPIPPDIEAADEPTKVPLAIEDWLTVIIMGALALITFANVIVRYFTDSSFAWTEEFSVFLMIMLALVAGSAAVARDRHIRIEYFSESGSMARRKRLAQFGALMIAVLFTLIGALSIRMVWDDYRFEETTPGIGLPSWWYSIWLPIVSFAIALRAIGLMIRRGRETTTHGDAEDNNSKGDAS
ncbi:TRAP-type C4-dicarboxylate transport system, small permease component [Variovorax sp. YR750]|uniref:TRAP transporter small permease n=1 Tax=Variovorax sp. YR750 TaxID=1884384 RepID=UPI0008C03E75|nr:TRAP transporter small permease [Variovorax sp. YR750]MDP9604496.1 TRAP-type C4-dicarboxylate transport system permease small subunit [Variovorax paradoxus]SEM28718.1 TRAP-type C4-dicarboxylate transport system, small permease component [Variovorax sp. YR750]